MSQFKINAFIVQFCKLLKKSFIEKKEKGPIISDGLSSYAHSRVRSHYCSTRGLLPAGFPPWACASLLRQPGHLKLLQDAHIDAELSVDTRSTWRTREQNPRPQTVLRLKPPSSWITGARHNSQRYVDQI